MKNLAVGIINVIGEFSIIDMIILISLVAFIILIISIIYMYRITTMEIEESEVNDMLDLKAISKELEESKKEVTIDLTPYEKEQEEKAIISYDELIKSNSTMKINYASEDDSLGVKIKQVDLKNIAKEDENSLDTQVKSISYEQEEAFLEALKKLESMLL